MSFDFNNAEPQRAGGDLIPENTVVLLVASLRPGQEGPGGWLKANNDRTCLMADFEFTIDGGDYDRRKVWGNYVTEGTTDGHQKAANITRSRLRAMLESAHGIHPGDDSEAAMMKRQVSGWQGFDGLKFCAKIGIEKGGLKNKADGPNGERYADKSTIKTVLTPGDDEYINPGPQPAGGGMVTAGAAVAGGMKAAGGSVAAAAPAAAKPSWAS